MSHLAIAYQLGCQAALAVFEKNAGRFTPNSGLMERMLGAAEREAKVLPETYRPGAGAERARESLRKILAADAEAAATGQPAQVAAPTRQLARVTLPLERDRGLRLGSQPINYRALLQGRIEDPETTKVLIDMIRNSKETVRSIHRVTDGWKVPIS